MSKTEGNNWENWSDWRATALYHRWYKHTQMGEPNDFIIAVSAASSTPVSGTGKSTLLTVLANGFDATAEGFDAEQKATLDVKELAYERLPDINSKSAVVADEIQGNPGTEGLDARRGMKQSSIDAINSITANRDKELTVLLGAQILKMLDKRLFPLIDAWLLIWEEPASPTGPVAGHYEIVTDDLNLSSQKWRTPRVETLTWPAVAHSHPDYKHLEKLKQESKQRADDGKKKADQMPKHIRDQEIQELSELGVEQAVLAKKYDISQSMVSKIVNQ